MPHATLVQGGSGFRRPPDAGAFHVLGWDLPAVPAAPAAGSANEESKNPEDQPDDEHEPEDVKGRRQQAASTEEQEQQDQDDQRNHSYLSPSSRRATLHERPPASGLDLYAVLPRGGADASPGGVPLRLAHVLDLVESRDRVANVPRVVQRLLSLPGKRKRSGGHPVLLARAQAR